jgi:hypothetical protein
MKPISRRAVFPLVLLAIVAALSQTVAAQEPQAATPGVVAQNQPNIPDAAEIIRKAHDAQYSLPKQGMKSFRCSITIDWDALYKDLGADSESSQTVLALLKKIRLKVAVGPDGSSSLSRESDDAPPSAEIAERLQESQAGLDQMINGLLKTWAVYMVESMIPQPDEKYHLELVDGKYLLTQSENGMDLAIDFDSNLKIARVSSKSSKQNGEFRPTFESNPNGFVLTGYVITFDPPVAGGTTKADVKIENQTVDGLELPHLVSIKLPYKDASMNVHLTFSDYQVTRKLVDLK